MEPIPTPQVLNPNRVTRDDRANMTTEDHRSQAQVLAKALDESCDYARQLWHDLAAMRQYLHDVLPPEPGPGQPAGGAAPVGPNDEQGWQQWADAFAEVTSVLCGPHGDSGYGRGSAALLAQSRRRTTATAAKDPASRHPDEDTHPESRESRDAHVARDTPADVPPQRAGFSGRALLTPLLCGAAGSLTTLVAMRKRLSSSGSAARIGDI